MSKSPTVNVMCLVHENGVWEGKVKRLQSAVLGAYRKHAEPNATLRFVWTEIPSGQGWLAGEPSTATTTLIPVPDDLTQETRVEMMSAICDEWMEITGCSVNEIIVNAMPMTEAARYQQVAFTRFDPEGLKNLKWKMAVRMIWSKITKGYLKTSITMP